MVRTCRAYLDVTSQIWTPETITNRIGLQADRLWERGSLARPQARYPRQFHGWELASTAEASEPVGAHVKSIISRLGGAVGSVRGLSAQRDSVTVKLWVQLEGSWPGISLPSETLQDIGSLGCPLELTWRRR